MPRDGAGERVEPSFWAAHEAAVAVAGVDLSIHLRDVLRRPSSSDTPGGVGAAERVQSALASCDVFRAAVGDVLRASERLPETEANDRLLASALRVLNTAALPAVEFLESPDLLDPSAHAAPDFIAPAVVAATGVVASFALLRTDALGSRSAKALGVAITFASRSLDEGQGLGEGQDGLERRGVVDEVLDAAVAGIVALLECDASNALSLSQTFPVLATFVRNCCVRLGRGAGGPVVQKLCESHAMLGARALRLIASSVPSTTAMPRAMPRVWAALVAAPPCDGGDMYVNDVREQLAEVVGVSELFARSASAAR
jgi:hypothetical protein